MCICRFTRVFLLPSFIKIACTVFALQLDTDGQNYGKIRKMALKWPIFNIFKSDETCIWRITSVFLLPSFIKIRCIVFEVQLDTDGQNDEKNRKMALKLPILNIFTFRKNVHMQIHKGLPITKFHKDCMY